MDKMSWVELKDGTFMRLKNGQPMTEENKETLKKIGVKV